MSTIEILEECYFVWNTTVNVLANAQVKLAQSPGGVKIDEYKEEPDTKIRKPQDVETS